VSAHCIKMHINIILYLKKVNVADSGDKKQMITEYGSLKKCVLLSCNNKVLQSPTTVLDFKILDVNKNLIMLSLNQDDVKSLFNKEFDFVSAVLNQVKLPVRVEDSGKLFYKHVHLRVEKILLYLHSK